MVTLEQIKLLESKLTRAINFVTQVTEENSRIKKRNSELEGTIAALKEEKTRIEEGIVSALGKLNQFEDVIEKSLGAVSGGGASSAKTSPAPVQANAGTAPENKTTPAEKPKPVLPSAYTVPEKTEAAMPVDSPPPTGPAENEEDTGPDEADEDGADEDEIEEMEDSGEAELDIF